MNEKEVRAETFTLVDENGVARAILTTSRDLVSLSFSDGQGNMRALLSVTSNGDPSLPLYDCNGKQRAFFDVGTCSDSATALGFHDQEERGRVLLNINADGTPVGALFDDRGRETAKLP